MDQATCGVCRGPFVLPRVLPCGHSFCTNCLTACISHNTERNSSFSCPLCKTSIRVTRQTDIAQFPRNYDLENLVELLSKREADDNAAHSSRPGSGASNSNPQHAATNRQIGRGRSQTDTDDVDLSLALRMSLADSAGSSVDKEIDKEDADLARAIYFSQLDANPCEESSSTHQIRSVNLKISNLHYTLTTDHLLETFSRYGTIISAKVMTNQRGKSKGYGFVCYESFTAAQKAIREMNRYDLAGRPIKVQMARNMFA